MSASFNTKTSKGVYGLHFETDDRQQFLLMQELARKMIDGRPVGMELKDTVGAMCSDDYKARFVAEYHQTKIRYEKLKRFNTKIEAVDRVQCFGEEPKLEAPKHDCPIELLREQQNIMGRYLHILEVRAVIEGIEL